jgi:exopolysaccharide biosynthesis WecB/TagA/CpsF family protein
MPDRSFARFSLLGVGVHAVDYAQASAVTLDAARARRPFAGTALAVHGVMTGYIDPAQRARINALDLVTPDGQPVRWALNSLHRTRLRDRVYGPFLMMRICAAAASEDFGVFLFGSTPKTLESLQRGLRERVPRLRIVGAQPSRFRFATEAEWADDARALRASGARIVFCGLGCPRQEAWVHAMRAHTDIPLLGVGAAFSLWSGAQPMAPSWMQSAGLEWLFRLSREPRRLAHRYFVYNPRFIAAVLRQKMSGTSVASPPANEPAPPELRWS